MCDALGTISQESHQVGSGSGGELSVFSRRAYSLRRNSAGYLRSSGSRTEHKYGSLASSDYAPVKTEYSKDRVPLDQALVEILLKYWAQSYPSPEGWLFESPVTGRLFHQESIQQHHIRKAGRDAGLGDGIGWHTFRHSYRSWMDDTGAPMSVQKELMRHASIQTTMNVYGKAMTDSKRQAHSKIVEMVLKGKKSNDATASERQVAAIGSQWEFFGSLKTCATN